MHLRAARQRTEHIDVTPRTADIGSPRRKFRGAQQVGDFRENNEWTSITTGETAEEFTGRVVAALDSASLALLLSIVSFGMIRYLRPRIVAQR